VTTRNASNQNEIAANDDRNINVIMTDNVTPKTIPD
jgi:hypothetical protein